MSGGEGHAFVGNTVPFLNFPKGTQDYFGFMESRCAV